MVHHYALISNASICRYLLKVKFLRESLTNKRKSRKYIWINKCILTGSKNNLGIFCPSQNSMFSSTKCAECKRERPSTRPRGALNYTTIDNKERSLISRCHTLTPSVPAPVPHVSLGPPQQSPSFPGSHGNTNQANPGLSLSCIDRLVSPRPTERLR